MFAVIGQALAAIIVIAVVVGYVVLKLILNGALKKK